MRPESPVEDLEKCLAYCLTIANDGSYGTSSETTVAPAKKTRVSKCVESLAALVCFWIELFTFFVSVYINRSFLTR